MLRDLFVAVILVVGVGASLLGGPFWALLFYIWVSYFRPEQWLWNDWVSGLNPSYSIGIYLLAAVLLWRKSLRFDRRFIVPFLFVSVSAISSWQSPYSDQSWPFLIEFVKVALIGYLIPVLVDDSKKLRLLAGTMVFGLGLEGSKQGWGNLLFTPGSPNYNPIPFLGDNNGVALGMLMLLTLIVALVQTSPRPWERRMLQVGAIGVAVRAIVTYSRGAFLAAGALALFYLIYSERRLRSALGIVAICLIVIPVLPGQFWDRMNTITASEEARDESTAGRLHFWQVALRMAEANPVIGVGFNAFKYAYATYDPSEGGFGEDKAVHSSWFGALAELGIVGFALYVLMLAQTVILCHRAIRLTGNSTEGSHIRAFARALEGCVVVAIVGGTFLHIQYSEMLWHLFGLGIAVDSVAQRELEPVGEGLAGPVAGRAMPLRA